MNTLRRAFRNPVYMLLLFSYLASLITLRSAFGKAQYMTGRREYQAGRYAAAVRQFRWARFLGMSDDKHLGLALFRDGRLSAAERTLRRRLDDPDTAVALGVVLMEQGRTDEAVGVFREVLSRSTGRTRTSKALAAYNLSLILQARGDATSAKAAFQEALKWSSGEASHWRGPQAEYPKPQRD